MATTDNIGHTPCRTTTPSFEHSVLPFARCPNEGPTARKSRGLQARDGRKYRRKRFFTTPLPRLSTLKLSEADLRTVLPLTLSFPSPPLRFSFYLSFSRPNFSIPFHPEIVVKTLLSLLLSISICAIGRAILVSSFTGGFRTRLSRHLRASHAASSDHPFNEKPLASSRNEL